MSILFHNFPNLVVYISEGTFHCTVRRCFTIAASAGRTGDSTKSGARTPCAALNEGCGPVSSTYETDARLGFFPNRAVASLFCSAPSACLFAPLFGWPPCCISRTQHSTVTKYEKSMRILSERDNMPVLRTTPPISVDSPELADFVQLTVKQKDFIRALRMNPEKNIKEICETIGIAYSTYHTNWLRQVNFKRCLYVAYYDIEKYVASRAGELLDEALNALEEIIQFSNNDNARIKAAKLILQLPQNPSLSSSPAIAQGTTNKMQRVWERAITYKEQLTEKPMWDEDKIVEGEYVVRSDHEVNVDEETLEEIEAKARILSDFEKENGS